MLYFTVKDLIIALLGGGIISMALYLYIKHWVGKKMNAIKEWINDKKAKLSDLLKRFLHRQ